MGCYLLLLPNYENTLAITLLEVSVLICDAFLGS
jgi:hypothetical protein